MKVKRTCRDCGTVWHDKKGIFGDITFGSIFFNVLYSTITKGSAIDIEYMNDRDRKIRRNCPNCGSANVTESKIMEQEKAKVTSVQKSNTIKEPIVAQASTSSKLKVNWKLFFISFFFGFLGIDRFYVGRIPTGILKLLSLGGLGIWWLLDLLDIARGKFKHDPERKLGKIDIFAICIVSFLFFCIVYGGFSDQSGRTKTYSPTSAQKKQEELQKPQKMTQTENNNNSSEYGSLKYKGQNYKTVKIGNQTWMAENLNYNAKGSKCYEDKQENCEKYGRLYYWTTAMGINKKYDNVILEKCFATAMGIDKKNDKVCYLEKDYKIQGICPSGWHIPSNIEWETLAKFADSSYSLKNNYDNIAGKKLKAKSGWTDAKHEYCNFTSKAKETYGEKHNWKNLPEYCNGTDDYGFSALPVWTGSIRGSGKLDYARKEHSFYYGVGYWSSTERLETECDESTHVMAWSVNNADDYMFSSCISKINLYPVRCVKD